MTKEWARAGGAGVPQLGGIPRRDASALLAGLGGGTGGARAGGAAGRFARSRLLANHLGGERARLARAAPARRRSCGRRLGGARRRSFTVGGGGLLRFAARLELESVSSGLLEHQRGRER